MESLRASEICRGTGFVLVALERVEYQQDKTQKLFQMYGRLEPVAVVMCGQDTVTALDITGAAISAEHLKEIITELDVLLAPYLDIEKSD